MTKLFRRSVALTVDVPLAGAGEGKASRVTDLQIEFNITRTLAAEPSKGTITVYNLSESTRTAWVETRRPRVTLEAGYGNDLFTIFQGRAKFIFSEVQRPDVITTIECFDGLAAKGRRLSRGYKKGTQVRTVVQDLAKSLDIGQGNLENILGDLSLADGSKEFRGGFSVNGGSEKALREILESGGFEYSVQDDAIQITRINKALEGTAILLNDETGLIGTPAIDADGILKAQTLMIPELIPGRKIRIEEVEYRVQKATYRGSLYNNDFGIALEAKAL